MINLRTLIINCLLSSDGLSTICVRQRMYLRAPMHIDEKSFAKYCDMPKTIFPHNSVTDCQHTRLNNVTNRFLSLTHKTV